MDFAWFEFYIDASIDCLLFYAEFISQNIMFLKLIHVAWTNQQSAQTYCYRGPHSKGYATTGRPSCWMHSACIYMCVSVHYALLSLPTIRALPCKRF